jgi:hypothetical protein
LLVGCAQRLSRRKFAFLPAQSVGDPLDAISIRHDCEHLRRVGSFLIRTHPDTSLPQQGERSLAYVLDGKAVLPHHNVTRRRGTEAIYAKHITVIADVAMPALRRTCFHCKSRTD